MVYLMIHLLLPLAFVGVLSAASDDRVAFTLTPQAESVCSLVELASGHASFRLCWRLHVRQASSNQWTTTLIAPTPVVLHAGDLVRFQAWVRAPKGPVRIFLSCKAPVDAVDAPLSINLLEDRVDRPDGTWHEYQHTAEIPAGFPAEGQVVAVFASSQEQVVDLGKIRLERVRRGAAKRPAP